MLRRILRSTIVLAVVIAAYQAYVLLAVPHMEPPLAVREQRIATDEEVNEGKDVGHEVPAATRAITSPRIIGHRFGRRKCSPTAPGR